MRKIWALRKDRDKRRSFTGAFLSKSDFDGSGYSEVDTSDNHSTIANSSIGTIQESTSTGYSGTTKASARTVLSLAKPEYDYSVSKSSWVNVIVNTSAIPDIKEEYLRLFRAELRGSFLHLYKVPVDIRAFKIEKDTGDGATLYAHDLASDRSLALPGTHKPSLLVSEYAITYFNTRTPHPGLRFTDKKKLIATKSSVELIIHFILFDTSSSETLIDRIISILPLLPDFDGILLLLHLFLTNIAASNFQGEYNVSVVADRTLKLLAHTKDSFGGFLLKSNLVSSILKIIETLKSLVSDSEESDAIQDELKFFKEGLLYKQQDLLRLTTEDVPDINPCDELDSTTFMHDINLISFSKAINQTDLKFFKKWNSNIDKSLLLYSSIYSQDPQNVFYKKNPLVFDNEHHIHYLSRLLINHLFYENQANNVSSTSSMEKRARLLEKWIDLGCLLEKSGNMSSWLGIASIVLSQPVLRLTKVWSLVSPEYVKLLKTDWSPILFELDKRFLTNGSFSDQGSSTIYDSRTKDDQNDMKESYHIIASRGLGKFYPKENVIPYFGDLVIRNNSENIESLDSIWTKINYSFNRWNDYLSSLTNYNDIIKYNEDVLRRYDHMGFIFSNESLNQVLYLGVNIDDSKPFPTDNFDSGNYIADPELQKQLFKLIEYNCDSINIEKIMKLSFQLEPELPEAYLSLPADPSGFYQLASLQNSSVSVQSDDSSSSVNTNPTEMRRQNSISHAKPNINDSIMNLLPSFNNSYYKIEYEKYDDFVAPKISEENRQISLDSSAVKKNFIVENDLTLRIDDFVPEMDAALVNASNLQVSDDIENGEEDDDDIGLGIDVDDILNSEKFNNIDISDSNAKDNQLRGNDNEDGISRVISDDSSNYGSFRNIFIPKYASIDKLIDLLLIDAKFFHENISINLSEYRYVFLLNYNSFITTKTLIEKLGHRFMNSGNAVLSIMKREYILKHGDVDIQKDTNFPNWEHDPTIDLQEYGEVKYDLLLKIQINILKVLIVLINSFYKYFANDLLNKNNFIKLIKLFSNEILQWYNSNKIDTNLEKSFESLVNYYKKLKKLFVKKTYRPIEVSRFDHYLINSFRFNNSLHEVPANRNLPSYKNINKIEKFCQKFNKLLTVFFKGIKCEDWIQVYKVLEYQFETSSLLDFNLQKPSVTDGLIIISNIFHYFESLTDSREKKLVLKKFPLVCRKLFKLYFKFRTYLLIQITDANITEDERIDRMKTLLLMVKISKVKMSVNQFVFGSDGDYIPSCIDTAITNVVYSPISRLFSILWIKAALSLNNYDPNTSFDDLNLLLPTNITSADFSNSEPLLPCFGWIIENLLQANRILNFHKTMINFNKRYLIYKIIRELSIEDGENSETNDFHHESKEFEFLLKLDESLVNVQHLRDLVSEKDSVKLFKSVISEQRKILNIDNKKLLNKEHNSEKQSSSNSGIHKQGLNHKNSNNSLRRQSITYKTNASSRFKIGGLFGRSKSVVSSERVVGRNELPDPNSFGDFKQKPFMTITLKGKKIFPVYLLPYSFKIDSDIPNDDVFIQTLNDSDLNEWLVKLNYANRHWFYSRTLTSKIHHTITFGVPLDYVCSRDQLLVPKFIEVIFEELEAEGLKDIGIYRVSSSVSELNHLRNMIDKLGTIDFSKKVYDTHTLTSCIKLYFRSLPESLLTDRVIELFFNLKQESQDNEQLTICVESCRKILNELPSYNYHTLKVLFNHLRKVSEYSEYNKMTVYNLVTVIGPALTEASNLTCLINNFGFLNSILEKLLTDFDYIFDDQ